MLRLSMHKDFPSKHKEFDVFEGVGHSFNFKQYIDSEIAKHVEEHLCGIIKKSSCGPCLAFLLLTTLRIQHPSVIRSNCELSASSYFSFA